MTPCIITRGPYTKGYGHRQMRQGIRHPPHVWAWIDAGNPTPEPDECICHKCDVRSCINVEHLFIGTRGDNNRDRHAKGRTNRGVDRPDAKLTERDVRKIRRLYASGKYLQRELAQSYGVSKTLIGYVVNRKNWTHVW